MSTPLVNRATGETEYVDDAEVPAKLATDRYVAPQAVAVHRMGEDTYATPEQLKNEAGYTRAIDPARSAESAGHRIREDANTGVVAGAKAFGGGAISGLSFGALSPFEEEREFNPKAAFAGEIAGVIAPSLIGDEAPLLGLLGKGAAIADDALTAERAVGALSSKALLAGDAAKAGRSASAIEKSLAAAGRATNDARDLAAMPDLASLDVGGLRAARESELARIETERAAQSRSFVADLGSFRRDAKEEQKLFLATKGIREAELPEDAKGLLKIQEIGKTSFDADRQIDRLLRNPTALAESPKRALFALQQQETALQNLTARESTLREMFAADTSGDRAAALDAVPSALEKNRELQGRVRDLVAAPTSPRLEAIAKAEDVLKAPRSARQESLIEGMLTGSVFHRVGEAVGKRAAEVVGENAGRTIGHVVGAKAAALVKSLVFGHVGGVAGEAAAHAGKVVETIVGAARRAASSPLAPVVPVLATRVLANARFGASDGAPAKRADLAANYRARSQELRSLTAYDDAGTPVMRQEARAAIGRRLAPIARASPALADRMETVAARRVEFLSSKLPRRPDLASLRPDDWRPPEIEMRTFARYVAAAEDPRGVEDRLARGAISPEDAEAYHAVYPERAKDLVARLTANLPAVRANLPYRHRLALSVFTGTPVDPSMDPRILGVLQGTFAAEPGTQGGTAAPMAAPQFGSIKKSVDGPTPAQTRAQGR